MLTVGFDLDLTLVDPRPGVVATFAALSQETGVRIDGVAAATRLGPPLEHELARWFPSERVEAMADRYRHHFATYGVDGTTALPGAAETLAAVRRHGGRTVVVTAKAEQLARATLDRLGLPVDDVVGWAWGAGKAPALRERDAAVYVGDHPLDVEAALAAGATGVLVGGASGYGEDVALASLEEFPDWLSAYLLPDRLLRLGEQLRGLGSVLVAFSGGADSAFLLAAAVDALGADRVVAATAVSPSLPAHELAAARELAGSLGVRHETPRTAELDREGYRTNDGDRCWFCKAELLDVLTPLAERLGLAAVATGTNHDDALAGFRPGIRAAAERGAVTPLRDAGLTKDQVRAASRARGLATWDKPAAACLASRIAFGVQVTPARLARVERAESALRARLLAAGLSPRDLRVRDLGDLARVEVDRDLVAVLTARPELLEAVEGYPRVELDPLGFRSGSMNALLAQPQRWR